MLVPSGSYKYYSWESKWLLTWLMRAFPSSSFLNRMDSNNSGISLTGSNLHNNKASIKIRSENKQTETKWKTNSGSHAPTRVTRALEVSTRNSYARGFPSRPGSGAPGRAIRVRRESGQIACLTHVRCRVRTCLTSRWSTRVDHRFHRAPPHASRRVAASPPSLRRFFPFSRPLSRFDLFSFDFFIFQFVNRFNKFSSLTL